MRASGLSLFQGSHSHKESAAALKLDEGAFLNVKSQIRATRSPSISTPIERHFGVKFYIGEASDDCAPTTPHHGKATNIRSYATSRIEWKRNTCARAQIDARREPRAKKPMFTSPLNSRHFLVLADGEMSGAPPARAKATIPSRSRAKDDRHWVVDVDDRFVCIGVRIAKSTEFSSASRNQPLRRRRCTRLRTAGGHERDTLGSSNPISTLYLAPFCAEPLTTYPVTSKMSGSSCKRTGATPSNPRRLDPRITGVGD
jgi:hypothetical protein